MTQPAPTQLEGETRARRLIVPSLLVVGGLCAGLGLVAGHLNRNVVDGPAFAEHVDELRRDDDVAARVGESITRQIVRANPDLVAVLPLIESVAVQVAGGDLLSGPVRRAASVANSALTEPGADAVVLRIADAGAVVAAVLAAVAPERAPAAADISVQLASIGDQAFADTTIAIAHVLGVLAWLLPLLAVACLIGAVVLARDRWRAAVRAGWTLVWTAAAVGLLLAVGGALVRLLDTDTLGGAVGRAALDVFIRPMWWTVLVLAVIGATVVLTLGSQVPDSVVTTATRIKQAILRRPSSPLGVVARAAVAGAIGIAAMADPTGRAEAIAFVGGLALLVFALTEISSLVSRPVGDRATDVSDATAPAPPRRASARRLGVAVPLAVAGAVAIVGVIALAWPGRDVESEASGGDGERACNGHEELCDRHFDEVAYVASHNAMSVAGEAGWFIPEQLDPIPVQLDQGVRALLVDVWSGSPAETVVRTSPGSYAEALAVTEQELGPDVVAAARRITDSVAGVPAGPEARYLCHGLCETGSTPFLETLGAIRVWLEDHPDEVLTLFIEDHVDADLIASDIETAGLSSYAYAPIVGAPWPTLDEMIDDGQRLVVMLEEGNGGEQAPWLVNGFEHTQDTPYTFPTVESFSCDPNRGPADAPLLLLNHWLAGFTSLVTSAQQVNARDVLLPRAQQCEQERSRVANFVAVNYVAFGDVFSVVDELNGVT